MGLERYVQIPMRETSLLAWAAIQKFRPSMRRRILEAIFELPRTDDELERDLGLRHQSCSPRTTEMSDEGIIRDSGIKRRTRSGHWAIVWVVCEPPWARTVARKIKQRSAVALLEAAKEILASNDAFALVEHVGPSWARDVDALREAVEQCRKDMQA